MLRALRRQQVKVFTDQQRIGDDLNKSLEDTEKLRRKYIAARKYYEDKVNMCMHNIHMYVFINR